MILGIKYMLGSLEERASYKRSMLPYIVGAVLLFGGVNITSALYSNFALDKDVSSETTTYTQKSDGKMYCDKCQAVITDMAREKGNCFGCGRKLRPNVSTETTYTQKADGKIYCDTCSSIITDTAKEKGKCPTCGRTLKLSTNK